VPTWAGVLLGADVLLGAGVVLWAPIVSTLNHAKSTNEKAPEIIPDLADQQTRPRVTLRILFRGSISIIGCIPPRTIARPE
jgi:hypothetical protein